MRATKTHPFALLLGLLTACGVDDGETPAVPSADTQIDVAPEHSPALAQQADTCGVATGRPRNLTLRGNLGTHDPVVIAAGGRYYAYQTGKLVYGKVSNDLVSWDPLPSQLPRVWDWLKRQVPKVTEELWAPDVSYFGGKYHLYYSGSSFSSNRSCIGHATRDDLASGSWKDENGVICSNTGSTRQDWNAIDPNVVIDEAGTPWMSFGSFWGGIKLIKLTLEGKRADDTLISLAARGPEVEGAVEAPFIVRRCGYYYLFVSFDKCCKGAASTYRVMVARAKQVTGPYVDRAGRGMMQGGGSEVVRGNATWRGPGHNAVLHDQGRWYDVYHAYRASNDAAELRITEMGWDADGWPMPHAP